MRVQLMNLAMKKYYQSHLKKKKKEKKKRYVRKNTQKERQKDNSAAQKMKFSITDFVSKCDQICSFLRIWSHLLKKSSMKNFIFCVV